MTQQKATIHNVPKLRFPEFQDAGAWEEKKLEEFLTESRIKGSNGDIVKKITVKLWGKGVFGKEGLNIPLSLTYWLKEKKASHLSSNVKFFPSLM